MPVPRKSGKVDVAKKMTVQMVCAVVVSYHPTPPMLENLLNVLGQVDGLVVVDNGSDPGELAHLQEASTALSFQLIENPDNLGIAEALNQGVRWAMSHEYPWVILLDQDSKITDGFIRQLFAAWKAHPERDRICSIHPRYVNPATGAEPPWRRARDGSPITSITSGALMPTWVFQKLGWFSSEYFIDSVDVEYSYRIRAKGYLIADSRKPVLLHAAGYPRQHTILGLTFGAFHHNATRRYYMSRNRLAVYRKYLKVFPSWILQDMYDAFRETIKCFLVEEDRAHKFRNFLLGTWDGLTGRMGKREGL